YHISVANHLHTTKRNEDGKDGQRDETEGEAESGDRFYRQSTEIKNRSEVDEDVNQQPEHRHDGTHQRTIPLGEKLGHGVYFILQIDRQEEESDDNKCRGGHQLV